MLDVAAFMRPAKHVGGDLYSIFRIDDDDIGVMLGDVSGKGTPAALFMAKSVSEFKFNSRNTTDPSIVLRNLNSSLTLDDSSGLFVTMNYAIFDTKKKIMRFSNGGHMPILRIRKNGEVSELTPDGGMPLSLMPGIEYMNLDTSVEEGDIFVMYSDGISEARSQAGKDFEVVRLQKSIVKLRLESASDILKGVLKDIDSFVGRAHQHDDMTIIIVKIK
jgi:sigma-B regulation protein RsbU (phosphoserine phosphatase)